MLDQKKARTIMQRMRALRAKHFTNAYGYTDWKKISIIAAIGLGAFIVFCGLLLATAIAVLSIGLPDVHDLDKLAVAQSTTIYDREGNVLYVKYGEENREYKSLAQISPNLVNATIAIEDDQFYNHPGFDMFGFARAAFANLTGGSQQGGSTITQQYIKLTFLTPEKSYIRKLKELILAVRLEEAFDKDTILEKYLNKIPYGNSAFGAEKAAQTYFNKPAKDLTLAESAVLAAIPQAPSYYNPYGPNERSHLAAEISPDILSSRDIRTESDLRPNDYKMGLIGANVDVGNNRQVYLAGRSDLVLKRMTDTGMINEMDRKDALADIQNLTFERHNQDIKAPHFVLEYVIQELEAKYGKELVEQGGLKVYTTIDPTLQEIAEQTIKDRAENNESKYNVKNAALVSMNPQNGQILAMVGSRNYFDEKIDGKTNIATSYRQPGSSFKPIVYAAAFLNRYSPASVIFDVSTPFGSAMPKNYDGKFQGPITLRKALGQSRNIPAIKAYFLGGEQEAILPFAKKLGVDFMDESATFGYPMALGSAETTLLSMTNAYGTLANGGLHYAPISILRVENAQGEILEEWQDLKGEEALDPQIAYLITSILSDRSVNVGPNLNIEGQINAAKTGTSNRKKGTLYLPHDLLTMGYTTQLVTGVWAGNNDDKKDGSLNASADGYNVAAPIFKEYMTKALEGSPAEDFPIPEGIKQETVSKYSGKLVSDLTPPDQQVTDFFASFSVPTEVDDSYAGVPDFSAPENLNTAPCQAGQAQMYNTVVMHDIDPSRDVWEQAAAKWLTDNPDFFSGQTGSYSCQTINPEDQPTVKVLNLRDGDFVSDKNFTVQVEPYSKEGVKMVLYYLNNALQYKQDQVPFSGNIRIPQNGSSNKHTLTIRIYDKAGRIGESSLQFTTVRENSSSPATTTPSDSSPTPDTAPVSLTSTTPPIVDLTTPPPTTVEPPTAP